MEEFTKSTVPSYTLSLFCNINLDLFLLRKWFNNLDSFYTNINKIIIIKKIYNWILIKFILTKFCIFLNRKFIIKKNVKFTKAMLEYFNTIHIVYV